MTLSIYEYSKLDLNKRASILWLEGRYIDSYVTVNMNCNLYQLYDYYVEVILNHDGTDITEITPFKKGFRLEKYLMKVSIENLM